MASRTASRALRQTARQLATPAVQRRTLVTGLNAARASAVAVPKVAAPVFSQTRGVKTIDFAGTKEKVYGMLAHSNWGLGANCPT